MISLKTDNACWSPDGWRNSTMGLSSHLELLLLDSLDDLR